MNRFILHIAAIDNRKKLKYATIFNAVMIFKCQFTFKKSLSGRSKGTLIGRGEGGERRKDVLFFLCDNEGGMRQNFFGPFAPYCFQQRNSRSPFLYYDRIAL